MKKLILFINVTKQCNLNCHKCYITEDNRLTKFFLKNQTLENLCSSPEIKEAESILVVWEGGEAALAGYKKLKEYSSIVKANIPNAKQTMVTNMLTMPNWLIKLCKEDFGGVIETTFAFGGKFTWSGSEDVYIDKFKSSLKKAIDSGLNCVVNVELNPATLKKGPGGIIDIAKETGCMHWDLDFSLDFTGFFDNPVYNLDNYPIIPAQTTYAEVSNYLKSFVLDYGSEVQKIGMKIPMLNYLQGIHENKSFNIQSELNFISLNPDGTITTDPLFSDLPKTYLGNINTSDFKEILNSKARKMRARHERKRLAKCVSCPYFNDCRGSSSHVPTFDKSGECCGFFKLRSFLTGFDYSNELINNKMN